MPGRLGIPVRKDRGGPTSVEKAQEGRKRMTLDELHDMFDGATGDLGSA
jgi:hypothetical protein